MTTHRFPDDFLWGAATSALQIEGALDADGRGRSIWETYAATPGRIADGSDPGSACDHYRRWREDVEHMKWLGLNTYRFSIAWPRVLPAGRGAVNTAGLDFYDALVDALLEAGIAPNVTLNHWDLPQALQDEGGWVARESIDAFVDYTHAVTERLGDRVPHWVTHNEPWCMATLGYEQGDQAPGHHDAREMLRVAHHLLVSHGEAVDVIRANAPGSKVGIVLNPVPVEAASASDADRDAARRLDGLFVRWYMDPLFRGVYPADVTVDHVHRGHLDVAELPFVREGDLTSISRPIDFLGVNHYSRVVVRAGAAGEPVAVPMGSPEQRNDMGWEDHPPALLSSLSRLQRDYDVPEIMITENGGAWSDAPDADGTVDDGRKIAYLRGHLAAVHRAIEAGVRVRGYYTWSLLDNWEWSHGYPMRFGLFWIDYETQRRIPKRSAHWYRDLVAANALVDGVAVESSS